MQMRQQNLVNEEYASMKEIAQKQLEILETMKNSQSLAPLVRKIIIFSNFMGSLKTFFQI